MESTDPKKCTFPLKYTTGASQSCLNNLCTSYISDEDRTKCPDLSIVRIAPIPGCICDEGYALISPGVCGKIGECECLKVASKTDPSLYNVKTRVKPVTSTSDPVRPVSDRLIR